MSRTDRNRHNDVRDGLDFHDRTGPDQTQRMLTQVYDGGSIPTTVPKVFLTKPVRVAADDAEGAAPTFTVDSGTTIPVVMLGPKVPVAGDLLVAHAVGGRWVAEKQEGSSDEGPPTPISCGSCCVNLFPITVTDDNQTFTIDPITGFGGYTLTRPGVASVVVVSEGAACECTFGDATFTVGYQVECRDNSGLGPVQLAVSRKWHVISVHPDSLNTASCDLTDTSPFYADDSVSLAACCLSPGNPQVGSSVLVKDVDHCKDLSWSGTLTGVSPLDPAPGAVTITSTPTPSACGSATVKGCSGPSLTNLLPGATVVVKDASGATLVSGTTNSSGFYAIVVSGYPSTVTVSHDRFVTQVGTIPANQCCADFVFDLSLNVADGYHCLVSTDCLLPVANVLHATHPLFGAITLTYSSSGFLGVGWYTPNITYMYPGCSGCPAQAVTALCYMLVDEGILHDYWHAGSSDHCPDDTGDEVASTWTLESISCPPSLSMSFSLSPHAGIEQKFFCTTSPQAVTLTE